MNLKKLGYVPVTIFCVINFTPFNYLIKLRDSKIILNNLIILLLFKSQYFTLIYYYDT